MHLYHYTCRDMAARILKDGEIRPNTIADIPWPRAPLSPGIDGLAVIWLTTLDRPDVHVLGLTSNGGHAMRHLDVVDGRVAVVGTLDCDRTEIRFDVDVEAESWDDFSRRVNARWARNIAKRHRPWTWWLYEQPIREFRWSSTRADAAG